MAWTLGTRLINVLQVLTPQALIATANSANIDLKGVAGNQHELRLHTNVGTVTGTTPTLVAQVQDSPDGITFTNVPNAVTASLVAAGVVDIYFKTVNRYVRVVNTLTGTTPSYTMVQELYTVPRTV